MDRRTQALLSASRAIADLRDPLGVLESLLDCVNLLVPSPSATVLAISHGEAVVVAHRGWRRYGDPTGLAFPISAARHLQEVVAGRAVRLADTWNTPGWSRVEGSDHTRAWLGVPLIADGEVQGVYSLDALEVGFFHESDIGRIRSLAAHGAVVMRTARLQEDLRRARVEAARAHRAKSIYLASTSHELRTPLNAIIGYAEMIEERAVELQDPDITLDASQLWKASHQLLGLVDAVLDLSRAQSGRLTVEHEDLDLMELVQDAVRGVAPLADARDDRITVEGPEALPCHTDPHRVRPILLHLLSNAIKSCRGGDVWVRVDRAGASPRVQVQDSGRGLTPEELGRVFEPYLQTHEGIAADGGTGLGLTLARELVRLLGGELTVESARGEGTTFTLVLRPHPSESVLRAVPDAETVAS